MKVISLGLGVQSTAMLLMSYDGRLERADYAIFSDLGAERPETYENLARLKAMNLTIPIIVTVNDLYSDLINQSNSTGQRFAPIPAYTEGQGMLRRQCTREYKILPVQKEIRKLHGLEPRQRMKPTELWLGITTDEADRMSASRDFNITNRFPLIESDMSRADCAKVLDEYGFPVAKSSCVFCPYQSDRGWKSVMADPESREKAVKVDASIRDMTKRGLRDKIYLHRSRVPLEQVNFDSQTELFSEECSGYCFL